MTRGRGRRAPSRNRRPTEDSTASSRHPSAVGVNRKMAKISDENTQLVRNRRASLRSTCSKKVQDTEQSKFKELVLNESSSLNRNANVNNHLELNGSPNAQLAVNSRPFLRSANRCKEIQHTIPVSSSSEESSDESTSSLDHLVNYDRLLQSVRSPATASSPPASFTSTSMVAKDFDKVEASTRAMTEENVVVKAPPTEASSTHAPIVSSARAPIVSLAPTPIAYLMAASEQVTEGDAIATSNTGGGKYEASQNNPDDSPVLDRSLSLNLTEMVNMFHDDASSDSEIESVPPSLVQVSGYKVREASAGILRRIIEKHGDIASNCILATVELRSLLLESVCDIIDTLQNINFKDVTPEDLRNQLAGVYDLKEIKMQVDWLLNRLEKIYEAKKLVKDICTLKGRRSMLIQERDEAKKKLEGCRAEKLELKQKLDLVEKEENDAEEKVSHANAEIHKIYKFGMEIKPKLLCYEGRGSMVDGLL